MRVLMTPFGEADRALTSEELDAEFFRVARVVNGGLDAGNLKRTPFLGAASNPSGASYSFLQPYSALSLRGFPTPALGSLSLLVGCSPPASEGSLVPVMASVLLAPNIKMTSIDVAYFDGSWEVLGTVPLAQIPDSEIGVLVGDVVLSGSTKTFNYASIPASVPIAFNLVTGNDLAATNCIQSVSLTCKLLPVS